MTGLYGVLDPCACSNHTVRSWHACWTSYPDPISVLCMSVDLFHILWPEVLCSVTFWLRSCACNCCMFEFCTCTCSGSPHNVLHSSSILHHYLIGHLTEDFYWQTTVISSSQSVCLSVCVFYHSSRWYESFKSQSKVLTESTRNRKQNQHWNRTKSLSLKVVTVIS